MEERDSETRGRNKRMNKDDRGWVAKKEQVKQWGDIRSEKMREKDRGGKS